MPIDDRQVIIWCREGREEAYRELLTRYESYVYKLSYSLTRHREDALDLTQETFIKILNGLNGFQLHKPFVPWLRQVTINAYIAFLKKKAPPGVSLEHELPGEKTVLRDTLAGPDDLHQEVEWRDTRRILQEATGRLPPIYRMVIYLRHQEEMSYQDIADATGLPLGSVKTYLFRARKHLRQELSQFYGWEVSK